MGDLARTIKQLTRSKTINFNALILAFIGVLSAFGVEISGEESTAIIGFVNILLRVVTTKPIMEKDGLFK